MLITVLSIRRKCDLDFIVLFSHIQHKERRKTHHRRIAIRYSNEHTISNSRGKRRFYLCALSFLSQMPQQIRSRLGIRQKFEGHSTGGKNTMPLK